MSGGVVQLVAVGPQDAWLTGKPEVSFYRANYKRYTHYSSSVERQVIQGSPVAGGISTIRFEKKGDLLSYVYLTALDGNGSHLVNPDWTRIIDKVELYIGGQVIDTQDIEYMTNIEPIVGAQNYSQRYLNNNSATFNNQKNSVLPLKFFFCKDWSVCLPLIGLQFHDVEVRITWSPYLSQTITIGNTTTPLLPALPAATANLFSDTPNLSNTANVYINSFDGPIFPGMLMAAPTSNLQTNVAVVQSFSNISAGVTSSNVIISFANTAWSNISQLFTGGIIANLYQPVVSAQVAPAIPFGATATTSNTFTINQPVSQTGGSIQVGQYVAGLPFTGPVYVSNVYLSNVTVSYPSQATRPPVPINTTISFFTGTAQTSTTYSSLQYQCWTNFVYLDQGERDYFAKSSQDLLITQVQRVVLGTNPIQELALAQPVKFLAFPSVNYQQIYANGAGSATALNYQLKTQVNGVDVGDSRSLIHWTEIPQYYNTPYGYVVGPAATQSSANVAIISYCLDTSKLQPTGTLNFSRLDTYRLVVPPTLVGGVSALYNNNLTSAYPTPYLYAVGYNVLRIQDGLGGLLYSS